MPVCSAISLDGIIPRFARADAHCFLHGANLDLQARGYRDQLRGTPECFEPVIELVPENSRQASPFTSDLAFFGSITCCS
jgi:hypothetical protein